MHLENTILNSYASMNSLFMVNKLVKVIKLV